MLSVAPKEFSRGTFNDAVQKQSGMAAFEIKNGVRQVTTLGAFGSWSEGRPT